MKIHSLPAKDGFQWLIEGINITKQYWLPLMGILLCYVILSIVPTMLIPQVGGYWVFLASPILSFGVMSAFRSASSEQKPLLSQLSSGFKLPSPLTKRLLVLGLVNALGSYLILASTSLIDGGAVLQLVTGHLKPTDPVLKTGASQVAIMLFLGLLMPFQALLWYAPPFVGWHKLPVAQALFSSGVAVWRNRGAFFVFGITWLSLAVAVAMFTMVVSSLIAGLLGQGASARGLINVPLSVLLMTLLNAAIWCSYKRILVDPIPLADQSTNQPN